MISKQGQKKGDFEKSVVLLNWPKKLSIGELALGIEGKWMKQKNRHFLQVFGGFAEGLPYSPSRADEARCRRKPSGFCRNSSNPSSGAGQTTIPKALL
ncbi:MAG TPA: hypothetical protein VGH19_12870 [Verrucomicrobiae bacterium]